MDTDLQASPETGEDETAPEQRRTLRSRVRRKEPAIEELYPGQAFDALRREKRRERHESAINLICSAIIGCCQLLGPVHKILKEIDDANNAREFADLAERLKTWLDMDADYETREDIVGLIMTTLGAELDGVRYWEFTSPW